MRVVGVDATRGGWVGIVLENGAFASDHVFPSIETDFAELGGVEVVAIDVPIGFGPRRADAAARAYLAGAASTIFTTPRREILELPFGPGLGVTAQAHALGPRIAHVTELARQDSRFHEIHPEVSFRAMSEHRALRYRKRSSGGAIERIDLLRRHGIDLTNLGATARAPLSDVLDAAAAAWSANRILAGLAETLPDPPEVVSGHSVAIWY